MLYSIRRRGLPALALLATVGFVLAQEPVREPAPEGKGASVHNYRAKEIMGAKVSLQGDTMVGTVDDIVLDSNGNADYLIVVREDEKLVTVPWDALDFSLEKRVATVHVTPEQFKAVPVYTPKQYPVFSAPTYRTQVYKYYGLTPGQERRVMRRGTTTIVR
jgi:hypothetical protein